MTRQPQNMTFSQRKFSYFNILPSSGNLREFVGKIDNFQTFISLDFNLQYNREFLRYKALKMTLRRGPLLLQK